MSADFLYEVFREDMIIAIETATAMPMESALLLLASLHLSVSQKHM